MRQVSFLVVLVLSVLPIGSASVARPAAAQPAQPALPETQYGAISGNAFSLFAGRTGRGVEVVSLGYASGTGTFGIVLMNFSDAPVYGIGGEVTIIGDGGTASAVVDADVSSPYAVPTGGLAIQWGTVTGDDVGADGSYIADVTFADAPRSDGAPRLPIPFDGISRDGATMTAHASNGYLSPLYAPTAHLVCFDEDGTVTAAAEAVPTDGTLRTEPIPTGGDATYEFTLGTRTGCDYFLLGGVGTDASAAAADIGSAPIGNTAQAPAQAQAPRPDGSGETVPNPGTSGSGANGPSVPVAGCEVFASFDEAQRYYATHPTEQPVIDPDLDGLACEVFFGVETTTGDTGSTSPTQPAPVGPAPPPTGPIHTDFGGLDGVDYDCYDFASPAEAQAYFEADGGSVYNNADGLDRNHNGLACEPGEFD